MTLTREIGHLATIDLGWSAPAFAPPPDHIPEGAQLTASAAPPRMGYSDDHMNPFPRWLRIRCGIGALLLTITLMRGLR
jgi:hypothetical protein